MKNVRRSNDSVPSSTSTLPCTGEGDSILAVCDNASWIYSSLKSPGQGSITRSKAVRASVTTAKKGVAFMDGGGESILPPAVNPHCLLPVLTSTANNSC